MDYVFHLFTINRAHFLHVFIYNRLFVSNMHYNENANRSQAVTQEGIERWSIVYPKAQKGEKAVAKPLKEKPTYSRNNLIFFFIYELRPIKKIFPFFIICLE